MMQTEPGTITVLAADDVASDLSLFIPAKPLEATEDGPRRIGKLPERILVAAHQACDLGALDIAAQLLASLETVIARKGRASFDPAHRRMMESLIAVHHRLWHLRRASELSGVMSGS
jgi:hypothetical protein